MSLVAGHVSINVTGAALKGKRKLVSIYLIKKSSQRFVILLPLTWKRNGRSTDIFSKLLAKNEAVFFYFDF